MTLKNFFIGRSVGFIVLVIIGLLVGGFYLLNNYIYKEKQGDETVTEPYRATLTGVQVCLPHKDTSGPQTKECATGMKTDAGEYYVLDFMLMSQFPPPEIQNGGRFTASGVITPIERLSTDQWQEYNVEGIFSVTDTVQVDSKEDIVATFMWKFEDAKTLNGDGNPNTDVFLEVKYSNGKFVRELIDTTHGGCSVLDTADKDNVPNTTNMQCYGAGLGYTFKITKGERSYLVQRKMFEEGSPDYNPPAQKYEVIKEISFR